jgi:hypothetical protein
MTSENEACCAHKHVACFNNEQNGTVTKEWWACTLCGTQFVRSSRPDVNEQMLEALRDAKKQIMVLCSYGDVPDSVNKAIAAAKAAKGE